MTRATFCRWLVIIAGLVVAQSAAHLVAVGSFGSTESLVDLERSNAIPDVVSTIAIAIAAAGAVAVGRTRHGWERGSAILVVVCVTAIGVDDVVGVDRDPSTAATLLLTGMALLGAAALAVAGGAKGRRPAAAIAAGLVALASTLVIGQLPELAPWFERARGDWVIEVQVVVKQGLELAGWLLVALGLWDTACAHRPRRHGKGALHLNEPTGRAGDPTRRIDSEPRVEVS